ncbi:MAG: FkbM family methyltransferase, partial [Patescibacteria group bacterium]
RRFFHSKVLDKTLHQTLNFLVGLLARARQFYFPAKFSWDWKLEMLLGLYEKETVAVFKKIIRPGMTVVDIGAHIGYYTSLFAKLVGPQGRVYAFEADSDNFKILKKNTERRRNVVLVPQAVSDHSGFIKFYKIKNSTGCHSVIPTDNADEISVPAVSLDDFVSQRDLNVNAIKIDIEGGEPFAFRGMEKLFAQTNNLSVIMEFSPQALKSAEVDPFEFLQKIKNYGFEILQIFPNAETKTLALKNIESLDWYRTGYANLLLKKHAA